MGDNPNEPNQPSQPGASNDPKATSPLQQALTNLGGTLLRAAVAGARHLAVPVAAAYTARHPDDSKGEGNTLTESEREALRLASAKLIWELGTILTANHPVMPGGTPATGPTREGGYPEPSIAYVLSAVKAASQYWTARTERKAEEARVADVRARNEEQTPVPVSVLRGRR